MNSKRHLVCDQNGRPLQMLLSDGNLNKEALNKYRHSQIFRILNGSWESFDDFQPLSPSPGLEIGLYGF
jgi:hypothetical protein